ncbi:MAG TPA: tryptophan synthase subunit alpha [Dongiaceae bacterium]|jgi:tryptophan synthase alpha chain|nr:tryptophan synthase subunit alpha [Dongiaceae bacterium]
MSDRLRALFQKRDHVPLVLPYLTAGFPKPEETVDLLCVLEESGADAIELGLPFSDPLADGPIIQAASQTALDAGIDHHRILEQVAAFRARSRTPLLLMGYVNPILAYGAERFFKDAGEAGADGVIVPDVPIEEADPFLPLARAAGLDWIFLVAPTSSNARIERIDAQSDAFCYCVSVTGVTGVRDDLPPDLRSYLERAASRLTKPFVVGFGFSKAAQIRDVCPPAAGVVVGSALLRRLAAEASPEGRRKAARVFLTSLRNG